ncbi:MAG: GNAT family N-acetyltransferase [Bacilli bacterium]|nr:GNAT family N-acetyltransferase [Bacilli bacterium]MBN2877852.1 GNAT family N-acetyltransferase [Bacilli bacterium]
MIIVPENQKEKIYQLFLQQSIFQNFIRYAIRDLNPDLYVNSLDDPKIAMMYTPPVYFLHGDPLANGGEDILELIRPDSWIVPDREEWNVYVETAFRNQLDVFPRILFRSDALSLEHILSFRKPLPKGLRIEKIQAQHLKEDTMIQVDVTRRFFRVRDFLRNGFGFVLLNEDNIPQGFALTNYPVEGKEVEVYFRVGYDDYPKYRNQGLGLQLCIAFLEYCLNNDYIPVWDAAHAISSHLASKLGYLEDISWTMYHRR